MPATPTPIAILALLALGLLIPAVTVAEETCTCTQAREAHGWCEACGVGYIADVPLDSRYLWETLDAHGHQLNIDNLGCSECKTAAATDGFCEQSRMGFLAGEAYFSRLTWLLAKAERDEPETLDCPTCRKHAAGSGWCERHSVGRVGRWTLHDRSEFEALAHEMRILVTANDAALRCEHCAAAIVTNTECPFCRIRYRDGEPTPIDQAGGPL